MNELRFDGRTAVITGAGRRGRPCPRPLARVAWGASVVADLGGELDGSGASEKPADAVVQEIRNAGGEAVAWYASVAEEQGAASVVEAALHAFGRLDILVNNAGISSPELFENQTLAQIRRLLEVHYLGSIYVTKAAWPHLIAAGYGAHC